MAIVYRHIRKDKNEPFYIGIGSNERRARETRGRSSAWKAIASKGYDIEILFHDLTREQAIEKEKEFISLYGRKKFGGLLVNLTEGGDGSIGYKHDERSKEKMKLAQTQEVRRKKSESKKGIKNPNFNKKWSEERIKLMSEFFTGRKLTIEQIEKTRQSHLGKKRSEESKQKMKDAWEKNRQKRIEICIESWKKRKNNTRQTETTLP